MRARLSALVELLPRPLDPVRSIKLKLGILLVASGGAALAYFWLMIGWIPPTTSVTAIIGALLTSQILAHGMTRPLREMTAAARAMARGDYSRRIRVTARDEVGELGRAFNQMSADLADVDRTRRELIANVSHELRTPIAALHAVLENVVDGVSPADPATLRTALAQTERLGRLVTELLDLSRIDAGAHPLRLEPVAVAPLLADVVAEAEVNAAATARTPTFRVSVEPSAAVVRADPERLHQVLANLLDNAVRHGPADGEVRVTATMGPTGLTLEVADDGPGIAVEERAQVFGRFTRGDRASGGGTGLGLSIARWAVDLHGGTIGVIDSTRGCRIRVTLPA
ncbi:MULTISPECIES: HAMP domain-containing sensor histidine kinase [Actinokineospora]|uniref:Signal transduction histidine-protein kinase/phosphatase MprB n=1 Tax=Actinokineospora fastidiosa TaxID=1816 RepID=A0A918GT98_9PSEU|nr:MULTISPECIES: ATP-binding protein [Actinokineospora]UVS79072.1 Signal transduction histidine-protein kinase BaeS [Actinokineospora sp. UTMC 2448]GGS56356.1 two-component sensor histidine kinase [Actinokineospora fastidiosa]